MKIDLMKIVILKTMLTIATNSKTGVGTTNTHQNTGVNNNQE